MTSSFPRSRDADSRRDRLVETTLELLAFDTQNPPGETRALVRWLKTQIEDLGCSVEWIAADDARPNLVVTVPGDRDVRQRRGNGR